MQIILDTHALIWWWGNDPRLPEGMRDLIGDADTVVYVSAICALEIAIKVRIGKLPEMENRIEHFHQAVREDGFIDLNFHYQHAVKAGLLPGDHRDPFDRSIAAQSLIERLPVITGDREIARFGCRTLW